MIGFEFCILFGSMIIVNALLFYFIENNLNDFVNDIKTWMKDLKKNKKQ